MAGLTFGWMTPPLLAGAKTVLRQTWGARTASHFREGDTVTAHARDPRRGSPVLAALRLVCPLVYEPLRAMPDSDYEAEGWKWLYEHPEFLSRGLRREDFSWEAFEAWRSRPYSTWVVRFEVVELYVALVPPDQGTRLARSRRGMHRVEQARREGK